MLPSLSFHPALQNQDGRHPVDGFAAFLDRDLGRAQQTVRFGGGQPFIPEMYWQLEALAQLLGEDLHFLGLNSFHAAHPQGQPDHNLFHVIIPDYAPQSLEVRPFVSALQGFDTLSSDPQRVGDGHADTPRSHVEPEDSSRRGRRGSSEMGILVVGMHCAIMRSEDSDGKASEHWVVGQYDFPQGYSGCRIFHVAIFSNARLFFSMMAVHSECFVLGRTP